MSGQGPEQAIVSERPSGPGMRRTARLGPSRPGAVAVRAFRPEPQVADEMDASPQLTRWSHAHVLRRTRARSVLLVGALALALLAALAPPATGDPRPGDDADYRPVRGPSAPAEHRFLQKTMPGEGLPAHAYATAAAQAAALPQTAHDWRLLGPSNIGGRVTSLALDPTRRDTVYAAAASGGVWVSTDAGSTFEPAWPDDQTQAIGAIATAPDGTLYVGTGEVNPGGGSLTYTGTGLYASRDRGASWKHLGLADSGAIGAIIVDPVNPRTVYVAAAGSLFNAGGDRGVFRSTDGGETWTRLLAGANGFTGATEVVLDPADRDRIYAVMWDHRREPDKRSYGGPGSGLYRSTDAGTTWQRLDSLIGVGAVGRIGLGVSASEPGRLYATVLTGAGAASTFDGFYTSGDHGTSWTKLPANEDLTESQSSYGWWFAKVWVDPRNAKRVHVAGIGLLSTKTGGKSWTVEDDEVHVDQHAMVWDPAHPRRVYLGNDGGVYRSDLNGDGGWIAGTYQPWLQFYSAAITPQDVTRVSGGTQDNGSLRSWGRKDFNRYLFGDGEENLINPTNKDTVYACFQYGNCFRSFDGGDTMTYFSRQLTSERRNWFSPMAFDLEDPAVMYFGGNRLNRSADGGLTWSVISPDLTGGPSRDTYPFGTITSVAPAADSSTLYVGTDDGRVSVSRDLGSSWSLVASGLPWVTRVTAHPSKAGVAYVSLSAYRAGSPLPHVVRLDDFGASITDLTGNLPQAPVNDVIQGEDGALYVATDQGVFMSPAANGTWLRLGSDLPLVPVDDIEYDATHDRLVAATFGRSLFETTVP